MTEMQWRDISEAPKDGTRVLIWITYAREWHVANFRRPNKHRDQGHGEWCDDFGEPYCADPSYWQPLPDSPSDDHQAQGGSVK